MRILISFMFLCSLFVASPANATDRCGFDYIAPNVSESMCWPLESQIVVIESPYRNVWGIRRQANELTNYLDLTFMYYRGVKCEDFPTATCLIVTKSDLSKYAAYTSIPPDDSARYIVLNTDYQNNPQWREYRRFVGLHELTHALGISHYYGYGLMGMTPNYVPLLSEPEFNLLQETYN